MKRTLLFAAGLFVAGMAAQAADSSCLTCHANDATMKALYLPLTVAATEAEG